MAQFEVLAGKHQDKEGIEYEKGEVLESQDDLDEMFREKFRRIGGKNKRPRDLDERLETSGGDKTTDEPLQSKVSRQRKLDKKAARDKALGRPVAKQTGSPSSVHWDEEGERKKFEKDAQAAKAEVEDFEEVPDEDSVDDESAEGEEPPKSDLGKDVTDQFEEAGQADLKVFKGKKGFVVADADEPDKPLKGGGALKDKKAVGKFVKSYRSGK